MNDHGIYEVVVGLEVHAQLSTRSKLFCGDEIAFGREPNTLVSPITLGHPGVLPKINRKAVELAVKMGLACGCSIEKENYFARKNYFYADLPKGYQVSQHTTPIAKGGSISIRVNDTTRVISLNRIHLEEDAGKSIHDLDPQNTCIDLNRAGTALIEIVTEPDLRSGDEAFAFLTEIRKRLRYLEVCDGNMEEGSLRCDANISVRKKGESRLGTKVEIKNLNSIRFVKKAIESEAERLIGIIEAGGNVQQQTRSYDPDSGSTFATRDKEEADDYRYFPEPDLTPFRLTGDFIRSIQDTIPALPAERIGKYKMNFGLSDYDAEQLTEDKEMADYFESAVSLGANPKTLANWMLGPVRSWLNEKGITITALTLTPESLVKLAEMVEQGKLSFTSASSRVFPELLKRAGEDPAVMAAELDLVQDSDRATIEALVEQVLTNMSVKVIEYKKGKKGLLALFVGEVMKLSKGKADPKLANEIILKKINEK